MNISKQYIAGFIDGEGYLGIIKKTSKLCTLGYYYVAVVKITQVSANNKVLYQISKFLGCGNFYLKQNSKASNCRIVTSLEFRGSKRVIPIAKKLLPYLVVKKRQAELLIKFSKIKIRRQANGSFKSDVDLERTKIYQEMRVLNKRGLAETKRKDA